MTPPLKILVGLDAGMDFERLGSLLEAQPQVALVRPAGDLADAWDALHQPGPDLLIVGCAGEAERALSFVSATVRERPQLPIVVFYQGSPNGMVSSAFEAGADEVLVLGSAADGEPLEPAASEVLFTLEKAVARRSGRHSDNGDRVGRTICVVGPKGGVGKTVVASNLGVSLAASGASVALVDLDLQCGDLALALDLEPERTMYDLATSGGALDAEKLEAFLTPHESGARVLLAPTRPDQATSVTSEFLDRVYALLHSMHDYVLVDTPPGFTPEVIALLDRASDLCIVTSLDVPSLKATKVGLETLTMMMGHELPATRLVLNRSDSSVGLSQDDVSAALGREPDALVPSSRGVTRSLNEGKPITLSAPRSEPARELKRLAHLHQPAEQRPSAKLAGGPRRLLARR